MTIRSCLGIPLTTSAIEGRPPGAWFAHQRSADFPAEVFVLAAQAGARTNTGLRNSRQRHTFTKGEFGPLGLYHQNGTNTGTQVRLHPYLPAQNSNSVWTFDGTLPPKLLVARYGEPVLFRHHNALPINASANAGFGAHTITTHLHNGHQPAESDGFTGAYFFPGQFYDYRWPMILAGQDSINTGATSTFSATPNNSGANTQIKGDWRETASTQWFHDHMVDHTAQTVYKGNAAMVNLYSAIDRGKENYACRSANQNNPNLCLPSGTKLHWGNRDYDVNLMMADKAWDNAGQLKFNIFNTDGVLGDRATVNWTYKPWFQVRPRRYRFRLLNASVSRLWKVAVVNQAGARVPFHMIANDGNIMEHAVPFPNAEDTDLPFQGIGERYDIIIDFFYICAVGSRGSGAS